MRITTGWILSGIIILLMGTTGFFAYQYSATKDELDEQKESAATAETQLNEADETFNRFQVQARDTHRRTDVNGLSTQLEVYYADNGHYPDGSTAGFELNTTNMPGLDAEALIDPDMQTVRLGSDPDSATDNGYHYNPSGCTAGKCTSYELGVVLEQIGAGSYKKNSLN